MIIINHNSAQFLFEIIHEGN